MEIEPFLIERWYERYEFTTELMLSSSDCESWTVAELLALEPDATERLLAQRLGYTETPGSPELRSAIAAGRAACTLGRCRGAGGGGGGNLRRAARASSSR